MKNELLCASLLGLLFCACGGDDSAPNDAMGDAGTDASIDSGAPPVPQDKDCAPIPDDLPTDITATVNTIDARLVTLSGFTHPDLPDPISLTVYLPPDYDENDGKRYPVLYAHDGVLYPKGIGLAIEAEKARGIDIETHLVVGINTPSDGMKRIELLSPSVHTEMEPFPDVQPLKGVGGLGEHLDALLVNVIKPYIDTHYATLCGRSHTAVFGYSLGGLMCLYHLMQHPDVFGRGHCGSSSYWWNDQEFRKAWEAYDGPLPERLWLDVGGKEGIVQVGPARAVRDRALARGMVLGEDLGYYEEPNVDHGMGITRVLMETWTVWSLASLDTQLPEDSAENLEFFIEPALDPSNPSGPAMAEAESSIRYSYPGGYYMTWPNDRAQFTSGDESIATVDETGHIMGIGSGEVTIEATVGDETASDTWTAP